jgi:hypothetical protein
MNSQFQMLTVEGNIAPKVLTDFLRQQGRFDVVRDGRCLCIKVLGAQIRVVGVKTSRLEAGVLN